MAVEVSPQADQSDNTTDSSPLKVKNGKRRHTNSDTGQQSSSQEQSEVIVPASPPKSNSNHKTRAYLDDAAFQDASYEDDYEETQITAFTPSRKSKSTGKKRKHSIIAGEEIAVTISKHQPFAHTSLKSKEQERPVTDKNATPSGESSAQFEADFSSPSQAKAKKVCLSKEGSERATASVSPLPSTFNDLYSDDGWRPFPGFSDDDMLGDTATSSPATSLQTDEPSFRKPSDPSSNGHFYPTIDTPAPARFASVPASRVFGRATQAVMNIGRPQKPSLRPSAGAEDVNLAWKQKLEDRWAAELDKRAKEAAKEAVKEALAQKEVAGPGPRTTAARKRSRAQAEGDNDDPEFWAKMYPPHMRLSDENLCAIAKDLTLGPQKRHDAAPYAFDFKNGHFRPEYEHLFPQIRFQTTKEARRYLRSY